MPWIALGALCGALSVVAGAFGAHFLAARLKDATSATNSFERFLRLAPGSPLAAATRLWLTDQQSTRN